MHRQKLRNGDLPASLEEIAPASIEGLSTDLKTLATDPFNGKPLIVKKVENAIIVYSVGRDGEDNGGEIDGILDVGFELPISN